MSPMWSRIAVISDVHGNVPALSAVLADAFSGPSKVELVVSCSLAGMLTEPPTPEEVIAHAESLVFSD